jgi:hypothetical protein
MTERDADIEFDFFEEPETREAARPERPSPRPGGPRRPSVGPPTGLAPLLRLVGLIAFAIVIVVLLVYAIKGCASSSKHATYDHYMTKVSEVGGRSQRIGRELNTLLTTPGVRPRSLLNQLGGLARREQQDVDAARNIDPPGRLRHQHQFLVEALQLRVSGLTGLATAFGRALRQRSSSGNGALLAVPAQRLLASDVVWDDSFKDPSKEVLRSQGVGDVQVPESHFLQNTTFVTPTSLAAVLGRVGGSATTPTPRAGGLHGTALVSTKALPQNIELTPGSEKTVIASTELAFAVTVKNSGNSSEIHVPVTLKITQSPAIVRRMTIDFISAGEEKTVTFRNLGAPQLTRPVQVQVQVLPVPNEKTLSNNSATYPVIFSLPAT